MADPVQPADPAEVAALRAIVEGTARQTGEEFFRSLVRNLSAATGVASAFVAEFAGSNTRVRSLAYWSEGKFSASARSFVRRPVGRYRLAMSWCMLTVVDAWATTSPGAAPTSGAI